MKNLVFVLLAIMFAVDACAPSSDSSSPERNATSVIQIEVERAKYCQGDHSAYNNLYVMDNNGTCHVFHVYDKNTEAALLQKGDSLYYYENNTSDNLKIVFKR